MDVNFRINSGDSGGHVSLACHSPRGLKESDMTEPLNNNSASLIASRDDFKYP